MTEFQVQVVEHDVERNVRTTVRYHTIFVAIDNTVMCYGKARAREQLEDGLRRESRVPINPGFPRTPWRVRARRRTYSPTIID